MYTYLATAETNIVDTVFQPVSDLFTGSVAPAVALGTVAVLGLGIAIRRVRSTFSKQ